MRRRRRRLLVRAGDRAGSDVGSSGKRANGRSCEPEQRGLLLGGSGSGRRTRRLSVRRRCGRMRSEHADEVCREAGSRELALSLVREARRTRFTTDLLRPARDQEDVAADGRRGDGVRLFVRGRRGRERRRVGHEEAEAVALVRYDPHAEHSPQRDSDQVRVASGG